MVHIGSLVLISFYCVCFISFYFFLFSLFFWVSPDSTTCWSIEVSLETFKIKQWSCSWFLGRISRDKLLNVTGFVQFGKNLSYILPPLASQNYLLRSISVKLRYQFLYLIYGYLFFRCIENVFEKGRSENKEGNSRVVTPT